MASAHGVRRLPSLFITRDLERKSTLLSNIPLKPGFHVQNPLVSQIDGRISVLLSEG